MTKKISAVTYLVLMFAACVIYGEDIPASSPPVWVYNGHCYRLFNEGVSWNMAKIRCEEMGGCLVSIETSDENSFLYEKIKHIDGVIFIGASDEEKKGIWRWAGSDKLLKFVCWDSGQPERDESNKNYAAFSPAVRKERWGSYYGTASRNKTPGENTYGFICEWKDAGTADKHPAAAATPKPVPAASSATMQTSTSGSTWVGPDNLPVNNELHNRFMERRAQDIKRYGETEYQKINEIYQLASRQYRYKSPEALENFKKLISKYPQANRAGCALLSLGEMCPDRPQAEEYLRRAIADYSDCFFGNGVQVGAYARFFLAGYYRQSGKKQEADKLYQEIREKYPDAVTNRGKPLVNELLK